MSSNKSAMQVFQESNTDLIKDLRTYLTIIKKAKVMESELREEAMKAMDNFDIREFDGAGVSLKIISPTESTSVDLKKIKSEDPLLYAKLIEKYKKVTKRKEYLKIAYIPTDNDI